MGELRLKYGTSVISTRTSTYKPAARDQASLGDLGWCSSLEDHQNSPLLTHQLCPEAKGGRCHSSCTAVTGLGVWVCWVRHHPTTQSPWNQQGRDVRKGCIFCIIPGQLILVAECIYGHITLPQILEWWTQANSCFSLLTIRAQTHNSQENLYLIIIFIREGDGWQFVFIF